jgi:hypothetical protein
MMIPVGQSIKIDLKDVKQNIPFVASLSEKMRTGIGFFPPVKERLTKIVASVIEGIEAADGVAESLKQVVPGILNLRQVDIKDKDKDNQKIVVKTFVLWSIEHDCWLVLVELPEENYWENKHHRIGEG